MAAKVAQTLGIECRDQTVLWVVSQKQNVLVLLPRLCLRTWLLRPRNCLLADVILPAKAKHARFSSPGPEGEKVGFKGQRPDSTAPGLHALLTTREPSNRKVSMSLGQRKGAAENWGESSESPGLFISGEVSHASPGYGA